VVRGTYEVEGIPVGIRTTSHAFGRWLDYALAEYRSDEDAEPMYSVVVGDEKARREGPKASFHILYQWSSQVVRTRYLPTLAETLLTEVSSFGFADRTDAIYLRAGLARANARTALVPAGLLPHIGGLGGRVRKVGVRLGTALWTAVDGRTGRVVPIRITAPIPKDALDRLGEMVSVDGEETDRLRIDEPSQVDLVCTTTSSPGAGGGEGPLEVSPARGLQQLAASVVNFSTLGGACLHDLAGLLREARCFNLEMAPPRRMLQTLADILHAPNGSPSLS
jgi:hypothetical protein